MLTPLPEEHRMRKQVIVLQKGVLLCENLVDPVQLEMKDFQDSTKVFVVKGKHRELIQQLLIQEISIVFRRLLEGARGGVIPERGSRLH